MSVAESTGTGLCSNEHKDISEKCSVSKEHRANQTKFPRGHVSIAKERHAEDGPSVRRCVVIGRRDGVRSLCAASKAKEEEPWPRLGAIEGTPGCVVAVDVFVVGMVDA